MKNESARLIFLIGFMGSGKSHEGNLLSQELGLPFVDLDKWIEEKEKAAISTIFSMKGEDYFRIQESEAIKEVYQFLTDDEHDYVDFLGFRGIIATGGGAPCFFDNMNWMNQHGITIWLDLPIELLLERLKKEKSKRPLLAEKNDNELKEFIALKLKERSSFYNHATIRISSLPNTTLLIQKIKDA